MVSPSPVGLRCTPIAIPRDVIAIRPIAVFVVHDTAACGRLCRDASVHRLNQRRISLAQVIVVAATACAAGPSARAAHILIDWRVEAKVGDRR